MSYNRNDIARGRGQIVFNSQTFFSKSDIEIKWAHDDFKITTSNAGNVDTRDKDRYITVTFTPSGQITTGILGTLYPYLGKSYMAKALGSTDAPAVVYFEGSGRKVTIHNACIFKQPDLTLQTGQTVFGQCVMHGLVKNETEPHAAAAYYTEAVSAYPEDGDFDASDICAGMYSAAWGETSPWDEFWSDNGFRVSFNTPLTPRGPDGTRRDYEVGNQSVKVTATPHGIGIDDIAALAATKYQGTGAPLGCVSRLANAEDLAISNADLYVILYGADIEVEGGIASPGKDEAGALTWMADRTHSAGAQNPIAYIGTAAPE